MISKGYLSLFWGNVAGETFALAHNGVLCNDQLLRRTNRLPKTKIETDSYIAVQLIEQKKALDFSSLKYMAEQVEGTFTFTVLDQRENLYFVKGNNPLYLYHYPRYGVYLYASTEVILTRALNLLRLPLGKAARIELNCGDILKITASGQETLASFDASHLAHSWGYWPMWPGQETQHSKIRTAEQEYLDELRSVACCYGFSPESVDRLLESGFSTDDIEEFLYEGAVY